MKRIDHFSPETQEKIRGWAKALVDGLAEHVRNGDLYDGDKWVRNPRIDTSELDRINEEIRRAVAKGV